MNTKHMSIFIAAALSAPATAQMSVGPVFGDSEQARLGSVVERVGDVDGDGKPDFAVGAPFSDEFVGFPNPGLASDVGSVTVYSGADGQLIWKAIGPPIGGTEFGATLEDAGDVNQDGHDDLLVGAPSANGFAASSGVVRLLSGADGSVLRNFYGSQTGERYGAAIGAGHMDTDLSSREVAIGAPYHDLGGTNGGFGQEGRVEVIEIWTGDVKANIIGHWLYLPHGLGQVEYRRAGFGSQVEYVGDRDSTGYGGIVVSAPLTEIVTPTIVGPSSAPLAGMIQQFEPLNPATSIISGYWHEGEASDLLGSQVKALPDDMNGDGHIDWASYAPGTDTLRIYHNPWSPVIVASHACLEGVTSITSVGDMNLDGTPDLAVGISGLGSDPGKVCFLAGGNGNEMMTIEGPTPGSRFGASVAGADMDGDGSAEVWVGAPYDDTTYTNGGAVYVSSESHCFAQATWSNYGSGFGSFEGGIPTLALFSDPVQGTEVPVFVGNISDTPTLGVLLLGEVATSLPVFGWFLSLLPFDGWVLTLPPGGTTVTLPIPEGPAFCGSEFYLQSVQQNTDMTHGWAFSEGVWMLLGS